jgi:hypothetical protein
MSRATFYRCSTRHKRREGNADNSAVARTHNRSIPLLEGIVELEDPPPCTDLEPQRACRVPDRALTSQAQAAVRDILYDDRFVDDTPYEICAALHDEDSYHCSVRTMHRILAEDAANKRRTSHTSRSGPRATSRLANLRPFPRSALATHLASRCEQSRYASPVDVQLPNRASVLHGQAGCKKYSEKTRLESVATLELTRITE